MSNGATAIQARIGVPRGGTSRASLVLPSTHVCQLAKSITFPTARSFVEPTADNKATLGDLLTRLRIGGTHNRLLISGHTDLTGGRTANQQLSERRTQAVQAILQGDPAGTAVWETLFNLEGWGAPELTPMVTEVGETDISRYGGGANRTNRLDLFRRYFGRLLGGTTVPPITATTPPLLACGQDQPLRGSRSSPSRDPSLPPITGEFRPNRRSEFFFFDSASVPITCSEYPKWTAACSLTPPAPTVTVTIAPIDTVRRGRTVDVQVTVNPSPLPFGTQVSLTLSNTGGTGEAQFATTSGTTLTISGSGVVTIRGVTASSAVDNIRLSATVLGQSAVPAQEDFTVVEAISIFLQFEVFNLTTRVFEPLPAGIDVDLMDEDPVFNDLVTTRPTETGGRVFFSLPDLAASGESNPDVFFLVHTNGTRHAGHTLPSEWSTNGWRATDGTAGLQRGFTGPSLGTPLVPIVFRVGVDFHARFEYLNARSGAFERAPQRIPVDVHSGRVSSNPKQSLFTDDNGEVHGVLFNISPGEDFFFHLDFEMTDSSINLPRAHVPLAQFGWRTIWDDADRKFFAALDSTSIGTHGSPEVFNITVNERNVALYFLKILREWSIFLFRMTNGAWTGVTGLIMFRRSISGVAFSWPVGDVNIPPVDHFDRSTITHELSHQIMWKEVDFSSLGIGYQAIFGNLALYHRVDLLDNPQHALIEGWAEFMESVFEGTTTPPFSVATVSDSSGTSFPLGPPPNNRGESVEGAFANGLWAIFQNHVVTSGVATNAHVPESANGDIMTTTAGAYLRTTAVRDRFLSMIWNPLKDLRPLSSPTSTDMLNNIRSNNLTVWHSLQPELQAFNMAMAVPVVTAVDPPGGPPAGGTAVTITGNNFTFGTATVTFNGVAATAVTVTGTTTLSAITPPGSLGPANVVVTTPAGSSAPFSGFTYARVPTVLSVIETGTPPGTPARGPTTGGTPITITGTDFQPGARVFLGGLPAAGGVKATDVVGISPTEITAKTPLFSLPQHRPGGTAVVVLNPDGQSGSLDPGFDYFLGPAPHTNFITPPFGSAAGGDTIVIDGLNFQPAVTVLQPGVTVLIDGRNADVDTANTTSTQITALTPARPGTTAPVVVDVEVRNPDGQTATGGFTYTP